MDKEQRGLKAIVDLLVQLESRAQLEPLVILGRKGRLVQLERLARPGQPAQLGRPGLPSWSMAGSC